MAYEEQDQELSEQAPPLTLQHILTSPAIVANRRRGDGA